MLLRKTVFFCLLIAIWAAISKLAVVPAELLPSPARVASVLGRGIFSGSLLYDVGASLRRILVGYGMASIFGFLVGFALLKNSFLKETLGSLLMWLQTIPSIAYMPLAALWFGTGEGVVLLIIVFAASWPIIINTEDAFRNIQPNLVNAARTMGFRGWNLFRQVQLPAAFPTLLAGLKLSWAFSWRALIAAELLSEGRGLGQALMAGKETNDMAITIAVLILIALLAGLVDEVVFQQVEKRVQKKWETIS
ncbi:MAG: ABC transporter permease [Candidatus Omnitrophota bacterium]|nr:ABC transporter permease [Candidatus Omnitrophota bacterium]